MLTNSAHFHGSYKLALQIRSQYEKLDTSTTTVLPPNVSGVLASDVNDLSRRVAELQADIQGSPPSSKRQILQM